MKDEPGRAFGSSFILHPSDFIPLGTEVGVLDADGDEISRPARPHRFGQFFIPPGCAVTSFAIRDYAMPDADVAALAELEASEPAILPPEARP